jgi:hypothetical protein
VVSLSRHKKLVAVIVTGIVVVIACFFSMSTVTAKSNWMTKKVEGNLEAGIQIIERDAPRSLYSNDGGYYVPDVNANLPVNILPWSKVEDVLLENLNEDIKVPLCKVSKVTVNSTASEITAVATLQFEVFPGIKKTITVVKSLPIPHYKDSTGDAIVN